MEDFNNTKEDISVLVTCYNIDKYRLTRCLDKLFSSVTKDKDINFDYKVYLIDNNSNKKETLECLEEIKSKYVSKINENKLIMLNCVEQGVSHIRNYFLNLDLGKYVTFIDGDDYVDRNFLIKLYKQIKLNDLDMVSCNFSFLKKKFVLPFPFFVKNKLELNHSKSCNLYLLKQFFKDINLRSYVWGRMYKYDFLKENHICFKTTNILKTFEDKPFLLDVLLNTTKIMFINSRLYYYDVSNDNNTVTHNYLKSSDKLTSILKLYFLLKYKLFEKLSLEEIDLVTEEINYHYTISFYTNLFIKNNKMKNKKNVLKEVRRLIDLMKEDSKVFYVFDKEFENELKNYVDKDNIINNIGINIDIVNNTISFE